MATDDKFLDGAFRIVSRMVSAAAGLPNFPRYAVHERLGDGAMAVVYSAEDRTLHRGVVLLGQGVVGGDASGILTGLGLFPGPDVFSATAPPAQFCDQCRRGKISLLRSWTQQRGEQA